jgi:CBS domain-containing protein
MLVRDVMSKDVLVVTSRDGAIKTGDLMESRHVGAAAVVEGGQFKGIVSKETFAAKIGRFPGRSLESLVVSDIMESDIDTVGEGDDLMGAVDTLILQKCIVDRLPVLSEGKVVGMLSKGDLMHVFAKEMKGKYRVSDLMHYDAVTVPDFTPLSKVVDEMRNASVKRVLVMSGQNLVGIIAIRDISLALFHERKRDNAVDPTSSLTAADIMTRNLITLHKKADAAEAAKIMAERDIGGIPVLDAEMEGIITRTDLLKGFQLARR